MSKFYFLFAALFTALLTVIGFTGVSAQNADTVPFAIFHGLTPNYEFTISGTKDDLEVILDDVAFTTEYCSTERNLICIQKPFLLVIPTTDQLAENSIFLGDRKFEISFASNHPPETQVCDYYNFTLYISDPDTGQESWFEFSEENGLEEIYVFKRDVSGNSLPYYVFSRQSGAVLTKKEVCAL